MTTNSLEERFASLEASSALLSADVQALIAAIGVVADIQTQQEEMDHRITRTRRTSSLIGFGLAIILPVVSILVYIVLIQHVDNLLSEQRADRVVSCVARNKGTQANIERETALARLEDSPTVRRLHSDSVEQLKRSLINCDTLLPATPNASAH